MTDRRFGPRNDEAKIITLAAGEVIQHSDIVTVFKQTLDYMAAYKTGAAGDENSHVSN